MNKVIAIIGSTATGKSNLAVQIARLLNGEIINSDSMQVYKGLDVLTNKIDQITLNSVPHHLMSFLEPGQEVNVQKFEELALEKISQIHLKNKIPIMCGGTNYYIQSVLFESSLIKENNNNHDIRDELEKLSTPKLLEWLNSVDPELSSYWHPNDRRKIIRSLEVFLSTGKKHSQYIDDSNNENRKQKARLLI